MIYKRKNRASEKGNIFFTLFGAVAIVGVLGASIMSTMRGPLKSMVNVNRRAQAEAQMQLSAKLALYEASEQPSSGDCDGDTFVEPVPWKAAAGAGPDGVAGSDGGGFLPDSFGVTKLDPWGTPYGYCVWDAGTVADDAACGGAGQLRIPGSGLSNQNYTSIAMISAGPDKEFQTGCISYANADNNTDGDLADAGDDELVARAGGSDDLVFEYTYDDARGVTGGLWSLMAGDPDTATINKEIEVAQEARFTGGIDMTTSSAALALGAASMLLPTEATLAACILANVNLVRINTVTDPDTIEICDDASDSGAGPFTWQSVAAGASVGLWRDDGPGSGTGEIYYNSGFAGIGTNDPDDMLDVVGVIGLTENLEMSNSKSVVWTSGAAITESGGGLQMNANGGSGVELTLGATTASLIADTVIRGSTDTNAADALTVEASDGDDIFVVQNDGNVGIGESAPGDSLHVNGNIRATGNYKIDTYTVLKTDTSMPNSILVGNAAGASVTGDGNTVVGSGAAATLTTGTGNIVVGNGVGTFAAGTNNSLNIGNAIQADLATDRVGIGYSAATDVSAFDEALEVNGDIDVVNVDASGDVSADDVVASGIVSGDDVFFSNELRYGTIGLSVVLGPPPECDPDEKLEWTDAGGWTCENDLQGGSGGAGQNLEEVLIVGNDAGGENAVDLGAVAIGSGTLSTGGVQDLELDVTGDIGATNYCDADGNNCFTAATVGTVPADSLDYDDFEDAMDLDASTTITADNAEILSIINTGTANSFVVWDQAADATPFVIDPDGDVGIGDPTPNGTLLLDVEGQIGAVEYCDEDGGNCFDYTDISAAAAPALSDLIDADAINSIDNLDFAQTWAWNTLANTNALTLSTNSTTAAGNGQTLLNITSSGANANATQTTYGQRISNTHTGATSTNVALRLDASGASTNTPLQVGDNTAVLFGVTNTGSIAFYSAGAIDSGLSRLAAATLGVGNGAQGDYSGTLVSSGVLVGTNVATAGAPLKVAGTGSIMMPVGTVANRPAGAGGMIRYNTDPATNDRLEYYDAESTTWIQLAGTGAGGSTYIDDLLDAVKDTTAQHNMVLGTELAMTAGATGNLFIGESAGTAGTSNAADNNIAIGYTALNDLTGGKANIAMGVGALTSNTTGEDNIGIGYNAGSSLLDTYQNVAIGYSALSVGATGDNNIAIGAAALQNNTSDNNTAVGRQALQANTSGTRNTGIGSGALNASDTVDDNTGLGYNALLLATGGTNTALGSQAGNSITTGTGNIVIGYNIDTSAAGASNELNIGGSIYGDLANDLVTIGSATHTTGANLKVAGTNSIMVPVGTVAQRPAGAAGMFRYNTDPATNDRVEYYDAESASWVQLAGTGSASSIYINDLLDAIKDTTAQHNMVLGTELTMTAGAIENLFIGESAGTAGTSNAADRNLAIGYQSLDALTTGNSNLGIGVRTLSAITDGVENVAIGYESNATGTSTQASVVVGYSSNAGDSSVAVGRSANAYNGGVAVGRGAGRDATGGIRNVAIGYMSLWANNTTGDDNVAIGGGVTSGALGSTSGDNNIGIGYQAGNDISTGNQNIMIGYDVDAPSATGDSQLNIGDTIYGDLANDRIRIGGSGAVGAGPFIAAPPATQTIAGTNTITANACGTVKAITSAGVVTTSTTDTFTTPAAAYNGCCMDVVNVGSNNITLDANANFVTGNGSDVTLVGGDTIRVCGTATTWYQSEDKVTMAPGSIFIDDLGDAIKDTTAQHNMVLGTELTMTAGAVGNLFIGESAGTAGTSNAADYNIAMGYQALDALTTGASNVAIGPSALTTNTIGSNNVALGTGAMYGMDGGTGNVAIGMDAMNNAGYDGDASVAIGRGALANMISGAMWNIGIGNAAGDNITTGVRNIIIGYNADAMSTTGFEQLNIGDSIYGDLANDNIRIGGSGVVGAGPFIAAPPAAQAIAATNTITANACGTVKQIMVGTVGVDDGDVTTNTTDTFTTPTAAYAGCCMDVINVETGTDDITLDANANFLTGTGSNITLSAGKAVRVCGNGTAWYQDAPTSALSASNVPISGLTAATGTNTIANGDYTQTWNWALTSNNAVAMAIGETSAATSTGTPYLMTLGTAAGSTATPLKISNSLTGSQTLPALSILPTWNTTGIATGLNMNVTDTASNASSLLMDLQVGGTSKFKVVKDGNTSLGEYLYFRNDVQQYIRALPTDVVIATYGGSGLSAGAGYLGLAAANNLTADVRLNRDAADTLALRNSTNAQTFNIYNTYTDASNYERMSLLWSSNNAIIKTASAGTGTARPLTLQKANGNFAIQIPTSDGTSGVAIGGNNNSTVNGMAVDLGAASSFTATSGTSSAVKVTQNAAPTLTSTMTFVPVNIAPTINYSAGTPGAGSYEALKVAVTETALPTGTNYFARFSGGAAGTIDRWGVSSNGTTVSISPYNIVYSGGGAWTPSQVQVDLRSSGLNVVSNFEIGWYDVAYGPTNIFSNTRDLILGRDSAAMLQMGTDSATPISQIFKGADSRAGTDTDTAGGNMTIAAGRGTGTGGGGSLIFQTAPAGASSTTANTLATRMTILNTGNIGIGSTAPEDLLEVQGAEATDSVVVLDADDGDDAADTWFLRSVASGNSFTISNDSTKYLDLNATQKLVVTPPAAEAIAAAGTITANACGTIKQIMIGTVGVNDGDVTTDTTNTFTAPAAGNSGCCMDVINVETGTDDITLDVNGNFLTGTGANITLNAGKAVRVCSNGSDWYQDAPTSSLVATNMYIDDLQDAVTDYVTDHNMRLGSNTAMTAGAINNTFIGDSAGTAGTTNAADGNTAVGYSSLSSLTTGSSNTAFGERSLSLNDAGWENTALGARALGDNVSGDGNTAVGASALRGPLTATGGDHNVAVGHSALYSNQNGGRSTAVGTSALQLLTTGGTENTAFGYQAGNSLTTGDRNVLIGYDVDTPANSTDNFLNIADTIFGDIANDNVRIGGSGAVTAGPLLVQPPATEAIAGAGTITANACGSIKPIMVGTVGVDDGDVTTDTTNTFTAPAAANAGCCMEIVNVETGTDDITLDTNANFITGLGTNITIAAGDAVKVCSNGSAWYQGAAVSSLSASVTPETIPINDLSDALKDTGADHNMRLGENTAMTAGAANNLFIGESAGTAGTTNAADNNIAIGYQALDALTAGYRNVAVGVGTLGLNAVGYRNTAIGDGAMGGGGNTAENVAVGEGALGSANDGNYNVAVGRHAMNSTTSGDMNVAIGHSALLVNSTSSGQVAIGFESLMTTVTGTGNTGVGYRALRLNQSTGLDNTALGYDTLTANTTGDYNNAIGHSTLGANTTGNSNVALGWHALDSNTDGSGSIGIGFEALAALTTGGTQNIAIGYGAGDSITTGLQNIIIGYDADTPTATTDSHLNIGGSIFGDLANDRIRIGGSGAVGAGPLLVQPPATEVIAGAATITANACGTIKPISAGSSVTTNTTDTFTAPAAANAGCCMIVTNVDTVDTITLDANANFITGVGSDIAVGPGDGVQVCSNGTTWYQGNALSSLAAGAATVKLNSIIAADNTNSIDSLNNAQTWDWSTISTQTALALTNSGTTLTSGKLLNVTSAGTAMTGSLGNFDLTGNNAANTGNALRTSISGASSTGTPLMVTNLGAGLSMRVNDDTGDTDTSPFVVDATGSVGVGTSTPDSTLDVANGSIFLTQTGMTNPMTGIGYTAETAGSVESGGADGVMFIKGFTDIDTTALHIRGHIGVTDPADTTPAIIFRSDKYDGGTANTSLGNLETSFQFRNGSNYGITMLGSGYVGIMTATPEALFEVQGAEATDSVVVLDADDGDDAADTWLLRSVASGNSFTISNDATKYLDLNATQKLVITPPATETIAGAATITANACGTIKAIDAGSSVTTNTTNTFTAPAAANAGCCMIITNVDTADTITLDVNANFITGAGTDIAVGPGDGVQVCSNGTTWYQGNALSSLASSGSSIDGLSDATYDTGADKNMRLGSNTAMTAGAAYNLFIGESAGTAGTSNAADANLAIGYQALDALTTGHSNAAMGYQAGSAITTGLYNVAVGREAMSANTVGVRNVAMGYQTLYSMNDTDADEAHGNVAIGYQALSGYQGLGYNVAIGHLVMDGGSGPYAGPYSANVAIGSNNLRSNQASNNISIGMDTMHNNTSGAQNVAMGTSALRSNVNGNQSVAIGHAALFAQTTGGQYNTALGFQAGNSITTGDRNIAIGYDADVASATGDSQLNIGDTIYGDLANDRIRIGGSGAVSAGPLLVQPPATETIAGGGTITANACGTIKAIQSTGNVTTSTTDTFTAPAAANAGCCMIITNVDTADTIKLDTNANFITGTGNDIDVTPGDGVQVCSNGTTWYQGNALSSLAASGSSIDGLSDATYDTGADHNMRLGSNTAMTAGAARNLFIGESAGTAGTSNAADSNVAIGYESLDALTTGSYNLAIGDRVMTDNTTGGGNVAIGWTAMDDNVDGGWNVAIGAGAMYSNVSSYGQVAIGYEALNAAVGATGNTAVGYAALKDNLSAGLNNTALGYQALTDNTIGFQNTAVGYQAMQLHTGNSYNTAIGVYALQNNAGDNNTAVGRGSLRANLAGAGNTGVGMGSLRSNDAGANNVAVGYDALLVNTDGSGSTAIGKGALTALTTGGTQNTALGYLAGDSITTGDRNIAIGYDADVASATGDSQLNIGDTIYGDLANDRIRIGGSGAVSAGPLLVQPPATEAIAAAGTITANACGSIKPVMVGTVGVDDGDITTDTTNTFTAPAAANAGCCMEIVNVETGTDDITLDTNGNFITGLGTNIVIAAGDAVKVCSNGSAWYQGAAVSSLSASVTPESIPINDLSDALKDTGADHNMRLGVNTAMFAGAANNLFIGESSGSAGTSNAADNNLAIGYTALDSLTTGNSNTAIGTNALTAATGAANNVAIGYNTLALTTADSNIAIGPTALDTNTTGYENVGIGHEALTANVGGYSNVAIGYRANYQSTAGYQNVVIGTNAARNLGGNSSIAIGYAALSTGGADNVIAIGRNALDNVSGNNNIAIGYQAGNLLTSGASNIIIGYDADAPANNTSSFLNIGDTIFGDLANDNIRIGGSGVVGAGPLLVTSPANQAIAGAGTITANACGGFKGIMVGTVGVNDGDVTTDTTNTFTAPAAGNAGCCMDVGNVETGTDDITLDDNGNFITAGLANITLAPGEAIRVCSNGTDWYQTDNKVAGGGSIAIDNLTDAATDYTALVSNMWMGQNAGAAIIAGGTFNLVIGQDAGDAITTGDANVGMGYGTLGTLTTGINNTAIGAGAMALTNTHSNSTALGYGALYSNVGDNNTAVGSSALILNTSGIENTAIGSGTLDSNTDGDGNTGVGAFVMWNNSSGDNNVAVGNYTLNANVSGLANTAIGQATLPDSTGHGNTAIGRRAGYVLATGDNNTLLGANAGGNMTAGSSNIMIGVVNAMSATADSQLNIGDSIFGDLANDNIRIGGSGAVSAGPLLVQPPATEAIAAAGTITANACGTIKAIDAGSSVTTNTTNTFTAPAAANSGCCMIITNVDTADTITLDVNANFITGLGTDIAVGPGDAVQVCSNGTAWYQGNALSSLSASATSLIFNGLIAATNTNSINNTLYAQTWDWSTISTQTALALTNSGTTLTSGKLLNVTSAATGFTGTMANFDLTGSNAANTGAVVKTSITGASSTGTPLMVTNLGAGLSMRVNDNTGDADATPFTIDASGNVSMAVDASFYFGTANVFDYGSSALNLRSPSGNGMNFYNSGNLTMAMANTGLFGVGYNLTPLAQLHSRPNSNTNSSVLEALRLDNMDGDSAGVDGIGSALTFFAETETDGTYNEFGRIAGVADDAANASRDGSLRFYVAGPNAAGGAASTEMMRTSPLGTIFTPPSTETIAGAATITANACGTIKAIDAGSSVTTNTTNTFTAPGTTNTGCCMIVTNVDTADTITLDTNANFITGAGTDIAVGPGDGVQVCSNGTTWYQGNALSSLASSGSSIDGLSDATYDIGADHNMRLGTNTAMFAGAANNLFIGESAGTAGTSNAADDNLAIGYQALDALTTGASNTAVGKSSMTAHTSGSNNTAFGAYTLTTNNAASSNTAVGYSALATVDASANTAVGSYALTAATAAGSNVAVGAYALDSATASDDNTAVGTSALTAVTTAGNNNVGIGSSAGVNITTGDNNIMIGYNISAASATGNSQLDIGGTIFGDMANDNIRIGGSGAVSAGPLLVQPPATQTIAGAGTITANACGTIKAIQSTGNVTTSTTDTFTAPAAANSGCCMIVTNVDTADTITLDVNANFITGAGTDIAVGPGDGVQVCSNGTTWYQGNALSSLTSGGGGSIDSLSDATYDTGADHNMRLGTNTAMTAGAANNLFIGESAGTAGTTNAADSNIAIGYQALDALSTGAANVAIGVGALSANTTPSGQVAVGFEALQTASTATENTAVGYQALRTVTASQNVAVGHGALDQAGNAERNVAVGTNALTNNSIGGYNVAIGSNALLSNDDGGGNVAVGQAALYYNTSGAYNVAIGRDALGGNNSNGSGSTAVGYNALLGMATGGTQNTALGYAAGDNITTGDNNIIIGYDVNAMNATANQQLNIGNAIYGTGIHGGTVLIGINNSAPETTLEVTGSVCVSDATGDTCTGAAAGAIMADGAVTANAFDVAERYAADTDIKPGTIVALDGKRHLYIHEASAKVTTPVLGIVSTDPGLVLGWENNEAFKSAKHVILVALAGRVPLQVTGENGSIKIGDRVALSATVAGHGTKAAKDTGALVGIALNNFNAADKNARGTLEVFVDTKDIADVRDLRNELDTLKADNADLQKTLASVADDIKGLKAYTGYGVSKAEITIAMLAAMALAAAAFAAGTAVRNRRKH